MREWTDEQKLAINAESGTLLICAAAGSGKTSVLVERIIRKLTDEINPVSPERLLVVTFTNAAAAEMRSRIYKRLSEMAAAAPYSAGLHALMARMDEMTVCTMDAFCMRLVRENFSACGVEPDFGKIEEGEESALKSLIARRVTDALYADPEQRFQALTRLFQAGREDTGLMDGIITLSDFSMSEADPAGWLDTVADQFTPGPAREGVWGKLLADYYQDAAGYCISLSADALERLREDAVLCEKMEPLFLAENHALQTLFRRVSVGDWDEICAAVEETEAVFKNGRLPAVRGYGEDPLKLSVQAARNEIKGVLKRIKDSIPATQAEHDGDVAALRPAAEQLILAVKAFNEALFNEKKERNLYGFSDITHFAVGLLYDPAAPDRKTPLARELSAGLSEILIDEYQDTNRVQDRLFCCLSQNEDNMFLVGDIKQSIYRFRLASPEIFTEKLEAYPKYDPAAPAKRSKIILSKNFRSRRGVTDMVNYTFSQLMSKSCGEIRYDRDEALAFGAEYYPAQEGTDTEILLAEAGERNVYEAEGDMIASLIEEKLAAGAQVFEDGAYRPAGYGDFCILLRSVRGTAEIYANALRRRNIPVFYDAREGFFETNEVRIALSFLRAVDDPLSDLDLLAAMLSPVGLFSAEDAARIRSDHRAFNGGRKAPLYMAVLHAAENGNAACDGFLALLERFRKLAAIAPAHEVIDTFYNETPVLSAVRAMEGGALREANLRALYEAAVRFTADAEKNLCSFLRYIDVLTENGAELRKGSAGGDKNCVSILTMHGSKGLEYPFVIVGGLNKTFRLQDPTSMLLISHEYGVGLKRREPEKIKLYETLSSRAIRLSLRRASLSEELRIYYVALTRAKEKFYIVCAHKKLENKLWEHEALLPLSGGIPPFAVLSASGPLAWFLPVLLRHPDCALYRRVRRSDLSAGFRLTARLVSSDAPEAAPAAPAAPAPDPALTAELRGRIARPYAYAPVSGALSLHTASQLQEEHFSARYFGASVPGFMFAADLSPVDVGTATHKFMEFCDFAAWPFNVAEETRRLVALSRLTPAEGESVNAESIRAFFSSPLFRRVQKAERVFKERSFTIAKSVCDFDPAVPKEFADEKTVVIGKIDLVFIENGEAVIVDYKTDRVSSLSELPPRYALQLGVYAEAVERALGYPVRQRLLYSLTLRDFIAC